MRETEAGWLWRGCVAYKEVRGRGQAGPTGQPLQHITLKLQTGCLFGRLSARRGNDAIESHPKQALIGDQDTQLRELQGVRWSKGDMAVNPNKLPDTSGAQDQ